jgi:vancomycin resistance protein YoaR
VLGRNPDWWDQDTDVIPTVGAQPGRPPTPAGPAHAAEDRTGPAHAAEDPAGRPAHAAAAGPADPDPGPPRREGGHRSAHRSADHSAGRGRRLRVLLPAAALGVLALAYLADLVSSSGEVPRGVTVSGVAIGGLSTAAAERTLRSELGPDLRRDVPLQAGPVRTTLAPGSVGLAVDWPATVQAAGSQPLNPFTRIGSFFHTRDVDVVSRADDTRLRDALDGIATLVRKPATDGGVRFDGLLPTAVQPAPGSELDLPEAAARITQDWTTGLPVVLAVRSVDPAGNVGQDAVQRAITEVAEPAVSGPVTVVGQGRNGTLDRDDIAESLTFAPDGSGGLKPVLDIPRLSDHVRPELASTEHPFRDASVSLVGGAPRIVPSSNGRGVDYPATFAGLLDVLRRPAGESSGGTPTLPTYPGADPTAGQGNGRAVTAIYTDQPAKLTTEQVDALGITGVVSTFSTGGFAADSGQNIKRAAETIDGTILQPGEAFSLNTATGPRDAAQGYVPAGIIEDGHPARGIGGGVSQLATTLYNAAYFAGMTDVSHREHSYYISRYPAAREATVFEGAIDLKFRNDLPTGVLVQAVWTPADITVKIWGTKRYEVTSATSPRSDPIPPQTLTVPPGQKCAPSAGGPGFTATDTRTMRDLTSGQTKTTSHTVHYKPQPKVVCTAAAPDPGAPAATPETPGATTTDATEPGN